MAKQIVTLAKAVAALSADDYLHFRTWVAFLKGLNAGFAKPKAGVKKAKRKYTKRAPAVEVAPGVKVKKRVKGDEVDHSPRSVAEQG